MTWIDDITEDSPQEKKLESLQNSQNALERLKNDVKDFVIDIANEPDSDHRDEMFRDFMDYAIEEYSEKELTDAITGSDGSDIRDALSEDDELPL